MTEQKDTDPSPTTTITATATATTTATVGETRANLFPQYLMKLLNDQVAPDALWWLPDGRAFALDPNKITDQVLDKHFQKTKYSSFIRRLHNEGFRRQTRRYKKVDGLALPEGIVVLSHDLFQRDKPQLLESFYKKSSNNANKSSSAAMNSTTKLQDAKAAKLPPPSHTKVAVPPPVTAAPEFFPSLDPLVRAGRQVSDQAVAAALQRLKPLSPSSAAAGGRQTSGQAAAALLNFSAFSRLSSATPATGTSFPTPTASLAASLGGGGAAAGGAVTAMNNGLLSSASASGGSASSSSVDAHHAHLASLSKSIAELREARLRRELLGSAFYPTQVLPSNHYHLAANNNANMLSSEDAIRRLLLQHGYVQGLSRTSSAESGASGNHNMNNPAMRVPPTAAGLLASASSNHTMANTTNNANGNAAAAGLASSMSRLQELQLETRRRRLQLEAGQQEQRHFTALDALKRAAYFENHPNR